MNCPYEKEQQRLLCLFEEVNAEEQPDDEADENTDDCVETREDSDTEQEAENEDEGYFESQSDVYFTGKEVLNGINIHFPSEGGQPRQSKFHIDQA
nr:unnamed protein product [Callosobruchus analis]